MSCPTLAGGALELKIFSKGNFPYRKSNFVNCNIVGLGTVRSTGFPHLRFGNSQRCKEIYGLVSQGDYFGRSRIFLTVSKCITDGEDVPRSPEELMEASAEKIVYDESVQLMQAGINSQNLLGSDRLFRAGAAIAMATPVLLGFLLANFPESNAAAADTAAAVQQEGVRVLGLIQLPPEPANALSLPTWIIHVGSVVEWVTAMALVWQYGDTPGNRAWKGLAWGMVPLLAGAMCACTWHFFYNAPSLEVVVALQGTMTLVGNCTLWIAAYRIYRSTLESPKA